MGELGRYAWQRLNGWPLLPLTLLVVVPGVLVTDSHWSTAQLWRGLAMLLLVAALRLFDDLADRVHDQTRHADRVLCQATRLRPFRLLLGTLLALGLVLLAAWSPAPWRTLLVVGVVAGLAAYGYARPVLGLNRLLNAQVVLLKYPALVIASWPGDLPAAAATSAALPSAAIIFALLLAHECLTDGEVRASKGAPVVVSGQLLVAVALAWFWRLP